MKKVLKCICALSVCLLLFSLPCSAEVSEWISRTGESIEAEFLNLEDGYVRLKTRSGKILRIKLDNLSKDSRASIKQFATSKEMEAPPEKPAETPATKVPRIDPEKLASVVMEEEGKAVMACQFEWHELKIGKDTEMLEQYIREKKTAFEISGRLSSRKLKHKESASATVTGYFYILNAANEVVAADIFEVLASRKSHKGMTYTGFLPRSGVYTAVIWIEYQGEKLGRTYTRFIPSY